MEGALNAVNSTSTSLTCEAKAPSTKPLCTDLTDDLCSTLWSGKNKGKLKVSDGVIRLGKSEKSEIKESRIIDLKTLLESEPRLPQDLREQVKPILVDLKKALESENDSNSWYRSMSLIAYQWDRAVEDVAETRTLKKYPHLKSVKKNYFSTEEKDAFQQELFNLNDQILDAKYRQHPNWLRVEKVFGDAQKDLIEEIKLLNIPEDKKKFMLEKVGSVKLSLPYTHPNKLYSRESCGTTETNAFYSRDFHTFSICAGYFNTLQSETALYGIIAHEISHAIDSVGMNDAEYQKESKFMPLVKKLAGAKGQIYSCDEWQNTLKQAEKIKAVSKPQFSTELQSLYDCLQPKEHLKDYTANAVEDAAMNRSRFVLSQYAQAHSFLRIAQPTETKDGEVKVNEFYMRPDRVWSTFNDNVLDTDNMKREPHILEFFTQNLSCVSMTLENGKETNYKDSDISNRSKLFEKAIEQTLMVINAIRLDKYRYCGRNCKELASQGLALESGEDFSDWLTYKALNRSLKRKTLLRERREGAAVSTVDLCDQPGVKNDAPDLAFSEKKSSLTSHPDNRIRRISVFNKKNAEVIKCDINEKHQGFGLCDL